MDATVNRSGRHHAERVMNTRDAGRWAAGLRLATLP